MFRHKHKPQEVQAQSGAAEVQTLFFHSGVSDVLEVLLRGRTSSVPATAGVRAADTGVLSRLLSVQTVVQQPVCPQTLMVPSGRTRHTVARVDSALTAHLVSVVQVLLLGQRQIVPGLHQVALTNGNPAVAPHAS